MTVVDSWECLSVGGVILHIIRGGDKQPIVIPWTRCQSLKADFSVLGFLVQQVSKTHIFFKYCPILMNNASYESLHYVVS